MANLFKHLQWSGMSRSLLLSCVPLMSVTVLACVIAATNYFYKLSPAQEHLAQAEAAYQTTLRAQAETRRGLAGSSDRDGVCLTGARHF